MVDSKLLARAGYAYLGRLYSEMDCQSFIERCLRDCGKTINLAGSNTWYRKMSWVGTPEECKKMFGYIPEGAFLFILENDGKEPAKYRGDGIGNASHIGIYTGTRQGAIHSSETRKCVAESRFAGKSIRGGWNRVGLWCEISYSTSINAALGRDPGTDKVKENGGVIMGVYARTVPTSTSRGDTVNMRKGASLDYKIVTRVPFGAKVLVVQDLGKWCQVKWTDGTGHDWNGYIASDYIEYGGADGEAGEVSLDQCNEIDLGIGEAEGLLRRLLAVLDRDGAGDEPMQLVRDTLETLDRVGAIVGRG